MKRNGPTQSPPGIKHLSERAQGILHRLLDQQIAPDSIARVIWGHTRERVTTTAITRYASRYRQLRQEQQRKREALDGMLTGARQHGIPISDLLRAVLVEKLTASPGDRRFAQLDVLKLEAAHRLRSGLELRREQAERSADFRERELALRERQVRVSEERFQLDHKKFQAVIAGLERKAAAGRPLGAPDLGKLKALYGLSQEEASINDHHQANS